MYGVYAVSGMSMYGTYAVRGGPVRSSLQDVPTNRDPRIRGVGRSCRQGVQMTLRWGHMAAVINYVSPGTVVRIGLHPTMLVCGLQ